MAPLGDFTKTLVLNSNLIISILFRCQLALYFGAECNIPTWLTSTPSTATVSTATLPTIYTSTATPVPTTTTTTTTTTTKNPNLKCGFGIPGNITESENLLKTLLE